MELTVENPSLLDIVLQYFPDATEDDVDRIIWNETGYPAFWRIGLDGSSPMECFLIQIARVAARENFGFFGYRDCEQVLREFHPR